ncbi:hypothetical protein IMZ38_03030 [Thermosphaera chiliense]|uniref:Uncharacterized protein n=1 Tax=Thermosphaera chiliense TaxID=3402707 RepID=A0A7M1URK3_9CREN|nr:hypothetical protein [Thermosphaera aggregans]QOR94900.1 hypothetical protein IMZ38_03030 [Thermosphaera aggregans]
MASNILKLLNIVAFTVVVIVNFLAGSTTIIGGKTTAQVSDAYPTLVTPAGMSSPYWGLSMYCSKYLFILKHFQTVKQRS